MRNAHDDLAALADKQHRVVSRAQAVRLLGPGTVDRDLRCGELVRFGNGGYHFRGAAPDWKGVLQAAVFDAGDARISFASGGRLLGFPGFRDARPEILVPRALDHRCAIAVVHESRRFHLIPWTEVDGLPVTTPEATVVLLAGRMRTSRLAWLVDELVADRRIELVELDRVRTIVCGRGVPGSAAVKAVLADRVGGAPVPESRLERVFLRLCEEFALPRPRWQVPIPGWEHMPGRVDGCFEEARLIVEVDGRRWHTRVADFDRDHKRDLQAAAMGYRVARITHLMMKVEPDHVAEQLRRALRSTAA